MQIFTDRLGRNWSVALNLSDCRRVREATGVKLTSAEDVVHVADLLTQREQLGDVLFTLCESQAASQQIDKDSFLSGLDANSLQAGWQALCDAFAEFSVPSARDGIRKAIELHIESMEASSAAIAEELNSDAYRNHVETAIKSVVKAAFSEAFAA